MFALRVEDRHDDHQEHGPDEEGEKGVPASHYYF